MNRCASFLRQGITQGFSPQQTWAHLGESDGAPPQGKNDSSPQNDLKRFTFRLQAVLTLHERAEQAAQVYWAQCCTAVDQAAAGLRFAEDSIAALDKLRSRQLTCGAPAEDLEHGRVYALLLQERRKHLVNELAQARLEAEEARREMKLAAQRREAIEKLARASSAPMIIHRPSGTETAR